MIEKTFAIIKPDAVVSKHSGAIINIIELNGFNILRIEKMHLTKEQAARFYEIHKERSFFQELIDSITSSPVIVMVLEQDNAIAKWRELMGATNPAQANMGTLRKMFGSSIGKNATHGSDSSENAIIEIKQFYPELV